ncbi:MAG: Putative cystathionine beta-synthase [Flavobacteriia bacterium]|nr:MAG: Putative cystathionine beta-synthase [Flavobacteriia bacterium]
MVLFHDHGSRYIGKVYNDDWMRERGFLPQDSDTAAELVRKHLDRPLITVGVGEPVSNAIQLMRKFSISQIPVHNEGKMTGVLNDSRILREMNAENLHSPCSELMDPPLPVVRGQASKEEVAQLLKQDHAAVLVDLGGGTHHILTRHDLISALA